MIRISVLITFCIVSSLTLAVGLAKEHSEVLKDPLVLGAWLYKSTCTRCHGSYESSRVATGFESREELLEALSGDGCDLDWSRSGGGPFKRKELEGLISYMQKWEDLEEEPPLPELPDLLVEKVAEIPSSSTDTKKTESEVEQQPVLAEELLHLLESNTVARGGYLYTQNCYRCHLSYDKARMGKGMAQEALLLIISEGKTSTQMKPFSTMLGGNLKNSEIKAVAEYIRTTEKAGEPLAIAPVLMIPPALDPADFMPLRLTRFRVINGDSSRGQKIYRISCRKCHGSRGEGYVGPSLRETKPVLRPDLYFKSVLKQGIPGSIMAAWDSSRGGNLSAKDLDDLISHLILWEHQGDSEIAFHNGKKDCAICHPRPAAHRRGKCVLCHDTIGWRRAS